jgi:endonuclease YncB( thermonuclease family)
VRSYRIADVDAPERGWRAECPAERMLEALARRVAAAMILGRDVGVETHYHDRWGRPIVSVTLPDGSDYAARLVEAGAALPWPHDDAGRALAARPDWCGERR